MGSNLEFKDDYRKQKLVGTGLGVLLPIITFPLVKIFMFPDFTFTSLFQVLDQFELLPKVLVLTVIPNLLVFFLFLNKHYNSAANGVLNITVGVTLLIIFIAFGV